MDPLTQGVVGVTAAQLVASRSQKGVAAVLGFLSGMAADLDVLIRSSNDSLLALEYHRHFTHSLIFIPVGALICALCLGAIFSWLMPSLFNRTCLSFKRIYLYCFAGYATHAVLDACTTYGTQLFWPFSNVRVAWNNVSVIDPLFTVPLMLLIGISIWRQSRGIAVLATLYALSYLGLGELQQGRAEAAAQQLAKSRGHNAISLGVKPSLANLVVWKSVYEFRGRYYIDAVRVFSGVTIYPGGSVEKFDQNKKLDWLDINSQQAKDIQRFRWFSNNHLALDPLNQNRIIDIRYSMVPNDYEGMWGITLRPSAALEDHAIYTTSRPHGETRNQAVADLWAMILGRYPE